MADAKAKLGTPLSKTQIPVSVHRLLSRYAEHCESVWQADQHHNWLPFTSKLTIKKAVHHFNQDRNEQNQHQLMQSAASLWSQWYFGLMLPPAALAAVVPINHRFQMKPKSLQAQFESGQPVAFQAQWQRSLLTPHEIMTDVMETWVEPVIHCLASLSGLTPRIFYGNVAAILDWLWQQQGSEQAQQLRQSMLYTRDLRNSEPMQGLLLPPPRQGQRRGCCLRFRLEDVPYCSGCPMTRRTPCP
ncbi:siderophore-iron reductase FhuF [Ferrimonas aestuarii]|nr:siderophore-iron reductase FhuF [Ferrimonas aestuarii]